MPPQHAPDVVILGYPALAHDHDLIVHAARERGLRAEVWTPESLQVSFAAAEVVVLRNGTPVVPRLALPRGVNRVWPFAEHILKVWQSRGTTVVNSVSAAATCADKLATLTALSLRGVPVMRSTGVSPGPGMDLTRTRGPLVVKPAFGSGGAGVELFASAHEAQRELSGRPLPQGAWRVEHAIVGPVASGAGCDYRVVVTGGVVSACTERTAPPGVFVTNGPSASVRPVTSPDVMDVAVRAAEALGMDFAGVDVIRDGPDRLPVVLEVNAWPGLALTSTVCGVSLADALLGRALAVRAAAPG